MDVTSRRKQSRGGRMNALHPWITDFGARAAQRRGAALPWLATRRKHAFERFADEGWPTTRQENWRHTTLAALGQESFEPASGSCSRTRIDSLRYGTTGTWLVFVWRPAHPDHP